MPPPDSRYLPPVTRAEFDPLRREVDEMLLIVKALCERRQAGPGRYMP